MGSIVDEMDAQGRRWTWLAKKMGVRPDTLWRWASGRDPWPANRAAQAAKLLGKQTHELFGEDKDGGS